MTGSQQAGRLWTCSATRPR